MLKRVLVTIAIEVEENVDNTDIKENIKNLQYLSEAPIKIENIEFDGWVHD